MSSKGALLGAAALLAVSCQAFTVHDLEQCSEDDDCSPMKRGNDFAGSLCKDNVCVGPTSCVNRASSFPGEDPHRSTG